MTDRISTIIRHHIRYIKYIATETLDGDNKYDAGEEYSLQAAEKGVVFLSLPPVLHLHLMRFEYDPLTDSSLKFNDRFEFGDELCLDPYLAEREETDAVYRLHAVLVHSGDHHNGHYVAYIDPLLDGNWCKFDDDVVSNCTKSEAIEHNFGGTDDGVCLNDKQNSNAYMLVYIRISEIPRVLEKIVEADIPAELIARLAEDKRVEMVRKVEKVDFVIQVVREECFETHSAAGYFDLNSIQYTVFRTKKTDKVGSVLGTICNYFRIPYGKIRIWPLVFRLQRVQMVYFDANSQMDIELTQIFDTAQTWTIYLEMLRADNEKSIKPFDPENDILIFMKYFDPVENILSYLECEQFNVNTKLADVLSVVRDHLDLSESAEFNLYEELGTTKLIKLTKMDDSIECNLSCSGAMSQGRVLIAERKIFGENVKLTNCDEYFTNLQHKVEIVFADKSNPNNPGYKDLPGNPVSSLQNGELKDLLRHNKSKIGKKLFFEKIHINIHELESKRQFKCSFISLEYRDEKELTLYVDKNATIADVLGEASKQVSFSTDSTKKLRLVEVANHKLLPIRSEDTVLEELQLNVGNYRQERKLRIEEVTSDELELDADEMLIPVSHFWKEIDNSFGNPFFMKAKDGEPFKNLLGRMQRRLNIPQKEWEKYNFFIIKDATADCISDDQTVNFKVFRSEEYNGMDILPHIGLEHVHKTNKKSSSCFLEKAIKIYN